MPNKKPRICFLLYTYNRPDKVERAIKSIINQTFRDFELVLIDNGSTDKTKGIVEQYASHEKVRYIRLEENIGSIKGFNFALDQINGEWFGMIGDDDYLYENAFAEAMRVVDEIDPSINAVSANAISTATGKFAGIGLDKDQYLPIKTIIQQTTGDFFGLTNTELLGDIRLNERLTGDADTLWYMIDAKANRYYIHKALMVYNTIQGDTETSRQEKMSAKIRIERYKELLKEKHYWEVIKKYNPKQFKGRCIRGMFFMRIAGDQQGFYQYQSLLKESSPNILQQGVSKALSILPPNWLQFTYSLSGSNNTFYKIFRLLFRKYSTITAK